MWCGAGGLTTAGLGTVSLLGFAQTFYLAGQMAVPYLPVAFQEVSSSLKWTMLDIK